MAGLAGREGRRMTETRRSGLFKRALGGGMFVAGSYVFAQFARLLSNLVLTRLLYPEAFGVMALVMVVLVGLQMFSDVGIGPAISRSPRGDDPDFLNTAWTLNVFRGAFLWLLTCVLAWPAAWFYAGRRRTQRTGAAARPRSCAALR